MDIGIDKLSFYVPEYSLDLEELAQVNNVDVAKYYEGLQQRQMAVCPPDEDIVTMAANAAEQLLTKADRESIGGVIMATESALDHSKSGAIHVHRLLDLPAEAFAFDLKQACSGGLYALQTARGMIQAQPDLQVLVLCTDIARYPQGSAGEPTQGAGAVAILVKADPTLALIDGPPINRVIDVNDFWRPAYSPHAFVDGPLSVKTYLQLFEESLSAWQQANSMSQPDFLAVHLPYGGIVRKVARKLPGSMAALKDSLDQSLLYQREIGNTYTGSLFLAFLSLLEEQDMAGKNCLLYSYGSGSTAIAQALKLRDLSIQQSFRELHRKLLSRRHFISHEQYLQWRQAGPGEENYSSTARFTLKNIVKHQRHYQDRLHKASEIAI